MLKTIEKDFWFKYIAFGFTIYPYQIALGITLRYWPCIYSPGIRLHIGCLKIWFGLYLKGRKNNN